MGRGFGAVCAIAFSGVLISPLMAAPSQTAAAGYAQGVNLMGPGATPNNLDIVAQSGAKWIRLGVPWWTIEPSDNNYNWADFDQQVHDARSRNLYILAKVTGGTPCWAMEKPVAPKSNGDCHGPRIPSSAAWSDFLERFSRRYTGQIDYIEVWNEPDHSTSLADGTVADYREKILRPGIAAIRRGNPNAQIVAPAIGTISGSQEIFERNLRIALGGGLAQQIDILSIHSYLTPDKIVEFGQLAKQIMGSMGAGGKPVWLTEYGVQLGPDVSEQDQANFLTQYQKLNTAQKVYQRSFWFAIGDMACPKRGQACNQYGLVDKSGRTRPVFNAMRGAIR